VAEFLSFNAVYEVIPFAIGVRYPETRKAYRQRLAFIVRLLNLQKLKDHQVIALSNGETRRVLLARALAKKPKLLVLDDPTAGLDTHQCAKLRDVVAALAKPFWSGNVLKRSLSFPFPDWPIVRNASSWKISAMPFCVVAYARCRCFKIGRMLSKH
jgi:ABC-type polar amino acid transport system ATPase subunit